MSGVFNMYSPIHKNGRNWNKSLSCRINKIFLIVKGSKLCPECVCKKRCGTVWKMHRRFKKLSRALKEIKVSIFRFNPKETSIWYSDIFESIKREKLYFIFQGHLQHRLSSKNCFFFPWKNLDNVDNDLVFCYRN